ncbi:hypothetical protein [uncultured Ruminococcus sp.]|uniref:hypothetical protein n=1 Tax=uncultured Ruminococcus sp. TaxID=165186 RepID=UPI002618DC1C|nr:hypothetical protein [uncultured Ruminococcus sp.]
MEFKIRLADVNIAINSIYDEVFRLCRDYLTDGAPELCISPAPADIELERVKSIREAETEGIIPVDYPDSYLETLAVYRQIATQMLERDTFLLHGAVVAVKDKAWLFTAPSGTGKTTHIKLWLDNIEGSYVVNGDKPLIHIGEDVTVYGTPWAGKEGWQKNVGVKLCGIVFLERGAENSIKHTTLSQVLPTLIQQSYRPNDKSGVEKTLALIVKLGSRIPLYRLQCNMLPEAALTAYNTLNTDTE